MLSLNVTAEESFLQVCTEVAREQQRQLAELSTYHSSPSDLVLNVTREVSKSQLPGEFPAELCTV